MASNKNTYELTYILNAVLNDDQIKGVVTRIAEFIRENGGKILESEEWGTQRLAYPIRKKRNGFYVNLYFEAHPSLIVRLERMLEIDDDVLRYLTLKMDAVMMRFWETQKAAGVERRGVEAAAAAAKASASEDDDEEDDDDDIDDDDDVDDSTE